MARMQPSSSDGVSRPAPPSLTTYFISGPPRRVSCETLRFGPALHDVQILNSLAGSAFQEIVEATDDNCALAAGIKLEANVRVVGPNRILNLRQRLFVEPHHWAAGEKIAINPRDAFVCLRLREMYINRGQNSAWNRQQM